MTALELDKFVKKLRKFFRIKSRVDLEKQLDKFAYCLGSIGKHNLADEIKSLIMEIDSVETLELMKLTAFNQEGIESKITKKVIYELSVIWYSQCGYEWKKEVFDNKESLLERVLELQDQGYGDQIQIERKIEEQIFFGYIDDVFTEK